MTFEEEIVPFEFHLPSLNDMLQAPDGEEKFLMIHNEDFRSAVVTGCPGSGKTSVSVHRFMRLAAQGLNVRLLTFQRLLTAAIRHAPGLHADHRDRIGTFSKWHWDVTGAFFDTGNPPSPKELYDRLCLVGLTAGAIKELIVDEGQDLPACVFEVLPYFAERVLVGGDNGQQVYPRRGARTEVIEEIMNRRYAPCRLYTLGLNFRNTYETYRFARQFLPQTNLVAWDDSILENLLAVRQRGGKPEVVEYRDDALRNDHLRTTLRNAEGNVAILCARGPQPNGGRSGDSVDDILRLVTEMGIQATAIHAGIQRFPEVLERYVVTTFKSAKGLEFDDVIIPRINNSDPVPTEWYVACTRARRRLVIYRDMTRPEHDPIARFDRPDAQDTYETVALDGSPSVDETDLPF
jgi:superfamily I DNA/RNA helicase